MRRSVLLLMTGLLAAASLTGCQKKEVKPGTVEGFERKEKSIFQSGFTVLKIHRRAGCTGNR